MKRCEQAASSLESYSVDALLITSEPNIRYVSGFTGSESYVFLSSAARVFITDSRFTEQAEDECEGFEIVRHRFPYPALEEILKELAAKHGVHRLGFEKSSVTFGFHEKLVNAGLEAQLIPTVGIVEDLRYVKDDYEIELIAKAARIADEAFGYILEIVKVGIEEKEIEVELDYFMRRAGASAVGFPTIIASGPRSSLPHAVPSRRKIEYGDFITMDFGALYGGYRSDMTRTVVMGRANDTQKQIYEIVRNAQEEGLLHVSAGVKGTDPDRSARDVIIAAGFGDFFGHGLGHGVGLEIHEEPFMSPKCDKTLAAGNVITVEPGLYLPKWGGVRIEDTVVVKEDGCEPLTLSPKELIVL
ncbi:MAG: Xaa-Pro peptidase family protein [Clostridia bacterium]|nr:Xaa-Pro peptidase family protein [Clostridia bacterium]